MKSAEHIKTINVDTGEIRVFFEPVKLQAIALGSCVALVVFERSIKLGGLAHIMLPGKSISVEKNTRYAEDAIESLLSQIKRLGADLGNLEISLVGGANLLQVGDIPDKVLNSVLACLEQRQLVIHAMRVGGIKRRSVFMDTISGDLYYTEGDNANRILLKEIERL